MKPICTIKYKVHRCGSCEQYGDTKEEILIHSDGKIVVREFDHHGPDGHYRIISRAEGTADIETVQELYDEVLKLIYRRKKPFPKGLDAEIVLEEPGLKISVDASITDGKNNGITLMNEFMDHVDLTSKQDLNT